MQWLFKVSQGYGSGHGKADTRSEVNAHTIVMAPMIIASHLCFGFGVIE